MNQKRCAVQACRVWPNQQVLAVKGASPMEDCPTEVDDEIALFVQKVLSGQIAREESRPI